MKNYLCIACFMWLHLSLSAQWKNEIKLSLYDLTQKTIMSSFEIIRSEKVGFEFGGGLNFDPANLYDSEDRFESTTHSQIRVKSSATVKFYINENIENEIKGIYFGPTLNHSTVSFLSKNFNDRQAELKLTYEDLECQYYGKREIDAGMVIGGRYVYKSKFLFNIGLKGLFLFEEFQPSILEYKTFMVQYLVNIGYRIWDEPNKSEKKNIL